jgi:Tol biopolymer transport system component
MAALPEFSRDGNYVLFLSEASNLTTNAATRKPTLNLYMVNRQTRETTLLSAGLNGEPANGNVVNFEISADNKRVLIETAASNMVANDTNNRPDIFVRDLVSGQNILVSVDTNGVAAQRGANNASMSADGNIVTFISLDPKLTSDFSSSIGNVFVRNIAAGTTKMLPVPEGKTATFVNDPAISDDGRYIAFGAYISPTNTFSYYQANLLYDAQTGITVEMAESIRRDGAYEPIMAPNGKYVTFGVQNGFSSATNMIVRYSVEGGITELAVSNNIPLTVRPIAIANDGARILYFQSNVFGVYREGLETRVFPHDSNGTPILLSTVFGMASMSVDGKFVTFSTDVPLLASDSVASQFRTYIYDVEQDTLAELPVNSVDAMPSDPVPNADGSMVVFMAPDEGIQEPDSATQNIYTWDRATGTQELISMARPGTFENSSLGESKFPETAAFSEDGQKMVFVSRAPAAGVLDVNEGFDVFVLDRASGRKELVSVSVDGKTSGSSVSTQPIISGNGRFVAFFSTATNLDSIETRGSLQLFVRDLTNGATRLIKNKDGEAPSGTPIPGSLSFSADGKLLCFASRAIDLDARDSQPEADIYVYDTSNDSVTLVSYDSTKTTGANADCVNPIVSPDGKYVAFRTTASNLGISASLFHPVIRNLATGALQKPQLVSATGSGEFKYPMQFNPDSTALYFGANGPSFYSFVVTNKIASSATKLVNTAMEASVSADRKWIAFSRRDKTTPTLVHAYLLNVTNNVETLISSNLVTGTAGNDWSYHPRISADGRFTVFESRATNLAANDLNGTTDVFVYDRDRKRLDLVSANSSGTAANGFSTRGVVSPDQTIVAFVSYAPDLVGHDYNEGSDIFAAHLPGPDTDADGIDDRWEMAHFGSLTHDMTGDTDGDGLSDAAEFEAGTDPGLASSTLRVISAEVIATGDLAVQWIGTPGRAYRLQARSKLDATESWQDVSDPVFAPQAESALEIPLPSGTSELYFRIVTAD